MKLNVFKSLFGLCVATAAVSCSNDQVIDDPRPAGGNDSDMISFMVADDFTRGGSFGNRPGSSTRSSVTTSDNIKNPEVPFAVYGDMKPLGSSETPVVLFNAEKIHYNSSNNKWEYAKLRYWLPERSYSFTAIHPHPADKSAIQDLKYTDNSLSFTYSPSSYTEALDLMTATHRRNSSVATTPVTFEFHHILSRINFKATVDPTSNKKYIITKLALVNVSTVATYTITPALTGDHSNDYTDNVWTGLSEAKATLFDITTPVTVDKSKPYEFFPLDDALMVIPQTVPDDVELHITYRQEGSTADVVVPPTKLKNITISAHNGVWEMGKSYTYSFTFGDNESIIFNTPIVQDWSEAEGGNYVITD